MITFEQYLEMQWARSAARTAGNWIRDRFRKAPADPGTSEFVPDEEPAATPAAPEPRPFSTPSTPSPAYKGYFHAGPEELLGYWDKKAKDGFFANKGDMTNQDKQYYWEDQLDMTRDVLLKTVNTIIGVIANQEGQFSKMVDAISKKMINFVNNLKVNYRKGGTAAKGTMSTLTKAGWSEAYDSNALMQKFEDIKKKIAISLQRDSMKLPDPDLDQLYQGMKKQLINYVINLKAKSPQQAQPPKATVPSMEQYP